MGGEEGKKLQGPTAYNRDAKQGSRDAVLSRMESAPEKSEEEEASLTQVQDRESGEREPTIAQGTFQFEQDLFRGLVEISLWPQNLQG